MSHNIAEDLNLAEQRVCVAELGKIIDTKTDGVISDVNAPPVGIFSACSLSVEIKGGDFSTSDSCVEEGGGSCSRVLVDVSGVDTGSGSRSLVVICLGIYLLFVR
ncbi:hypothetical protein ACOSP7_027685 [Xanthoceras sorbifolium]